MTDWKLPCGTSAETLPVSGFHIIDLTDGAVREISENLCQMTKAILA